MIRAVKRWHVGKTQRTLYRASESRSAKRRGKMPCSVYAGVLSGGRLEEAGLRDANIEVHAQAVADGERLAGSIMDLVVAALDMEL